jgi:hypothetical protein
LARELVRWKLPEGSNTRRGVGRQELEASRGQQVFLAGDLLLWALAGSGSD